MFACIGPAQLKETKQRNGGKMWRRKTGLRTGTSKENKRCTTTLDSNEQVNNNDIVSVLTLSSEITRSPAIGQTTSMVNGSADFMLPVTGWNFPEDRSKREGVNEEAEFFIPFGVIVSNSNFGRDPGLIFRISLGLDPPGSWEGGIIVAFFSGRSLSFLRIF